MTFLNTDLRLPARRHILCAVIAGAILGAAAFIVIWGIAPLDPRNTDLLLFQYGNDPFFVAVGAMRFLKEPWQFPPGIVTGLVTPSNTSIVYLDSIPIAAVIAKLFVPFFGYDFQYFGIWGLFCFILQGAFSSLIFVRYSKSTLLSSVACLFLVFNPFLIQRMFHHVSMTGHFLLLAGFALIAYRDTDFVTRHSTTLWALLAAISVGVLSYFTPMVMALCVLFLLLKKSPRRGLITLVTSAIAALAALWFFGGILPGMGTAGGNYGDFPVDLDNLFNPGWASQIFAGSPTGPGGGEGYAWIGTGTLAGALILLGCWLARRTRPNLRVVISYFSVALSILLFSASNHVYFFGIQIFSFDLPGWAVDLLSSFRTSARFIWPIWYMIEIAVIGALCHLPNRILLRGTLLTLLLAVQLWDGQKLLIWSHNVVVPPPLQSSIWDHLNKAGTALQLLPVWGNIDQQALGQILMGAVKCDVSSSFFWLGRYPNASIDSNINQKLNELRNGKRAKGDILLINYAGELANISLPSSDTGAFIVDDILMIGSTSIGQITPDAKPVTVSSPMLNNYVKHLKGLAPRSLIIVTWHPSVKTQNLDQPVFETLKDLGFARVGQLQQGEAYVGIAMRGTTLLENERALEGMTLPQGQRIGDQIIPVGVSINFKATVPVVKVGAQSASRSIWGVNIATYDLNTGELVETALFDGGPSAPGVVLTAAPSQSRM